MKEIKINVADKVASAVGSPVIVCGNSNYKITFIFDSEWGAYQEKTARFEFKRDGIDKHIDVLFSGTSCTSPKLKNIEKVNIGVYAGDLITTTGAEIRCRKSILCLGGLRHEQPTENIYNKILEIVSKKLGSEGGTVTGDYYKDGNTFIHEGNLELVEPKINEVLANEKLVETASGSAITIESANAPLQALKLYGKTTQNETPTPENPIELKSVGDSGSFTVELYGTNLLEQTCKSQSYYGLTVTVNEDKSVTLNGTPTVTWMHTYRNVIAYLKVGETYYFSGFNALMMGKNGIETYPTGGLITITEDMTYLVPYLQVQANKTLNRTFYPKITHLKELPYEPPTKQTLTIPYTLRSDKSGVTDEIDLTRGVRIQKAKEFSLKVANMNNTEDYAGWHTVSGLTDCFAVGTNMRIEALMNVGTNVVVNTDLSQANPNIICLKREDYGLTQTEWKTNYPDLVVKIILPLITPIETPLTETELNAYRQLYTNKGNTTILSEADMEVDYYINKPNAQAIGNIHSQINKDYFKLQQAIISTGGN